LHLIIYGKEVKIKHYDYMLYTHLKHRIIILPKIQAESGGYNFFIKNDFKYSHQFAFRMKTPVLPVPTDSIQNLLKPVPRYSKDSVKEPVPFIV
jgi:hypothetical protein